MRLTISKRIAAQAALLTVLAAVVAATEIPAAKSGVTAWYNQNIKPYKERKGTLDPELYAAEETVRIVKVRKDGSGDFATIAAALKTVPVGNTKRVIIDIGPGEYHEKVTIEANQNFVSLVGSSPSNRPVISYGGTAKQYGTVDSATIIILAKYFVGVNLIIKNSAPRPDPYTKNGQALALRINGDKAAFFNCKFVGFQDTLCDDRGYHFFKDCYIEGTVDFIFGRGTSLYVNAELFVIGDKGLTVITAHGNTESTATGFSFVHSTIHGTGKGTTFLGRPWNGMPRVIYAYCEMSGVVTPGGWTDEFSAQRNDKVYFGEYKNTGEGSGSGKRVTYSRELSPAEVKPFISLSYIKGESWLLPPPRV